jgi:hypothetical protein
MPHFYGRTNGRLDVRWIYGIAATVAWLSPAYAQYGGPALLTRGEAPKGMTASQIDFRPFLTLQAGYDSGINGVTADVNGNNNSVSSVAVNVNAGVSGLHSWRHTLVGLDYRVSLRHYTKESFFDGSDQTLMLGVTHQLTRHSLISFRQTAGMFTQNHATPMLQQTIPFDPSSTYIPTNDFFDNRTIYASSQIDLRIQRSTRLSYDVGVDGFITRRRSSALFGNKGIAARGDLQYRVSRRSTIGVAYTYTHYAFTGILSSTDLHMWNGTYAIGLSRSVEFSAVGGVAFYETKFVRETPVAPEVAAIICPPQTNPQQCVAQQLFYGRNYTPSIQVRLTKTIPRGVLFASGGHSIIPGNGLFLTSTSTQLGGGYGYTGLKRWSVNMGVNYSRSDSVGNILGNYGGTSYTASVSRQILPSTHFVFSVNAHQYQSGDFKNYNRWAYSLNLGLGFTPGDIPIRLW